MTFRSRSSSIALALVLGACSAAPADVPAVEPLNSGPVAVVDEVRSVVNDLEERSSFVDSQMRDPFSPP